MRALICARPAGFPWLANTAGSLAMLLRPGNAGSSTFAGHLAVLTAAIRQIPAARGIPGVPGSHHAQFTDVLHRQHAVIEDQVRAGKSMRLHNLPSKTWAVNCGWILAANLTANLAAWSRTLSLYDHDDPKDAEPDTLRYRLLSPPARPARHARAQVLKISRTWPWKDAFLACRTRLCAPPAPA